jgi:hypothetical protein
MIGLSLLIVGIEMIAAGVSGGQQSIVAKPALENNNYINLIVSRYTNNVTRRHATTVSYLLQAGHYQYEFYLYALTIQLCL